MEVPVSARHHRRAHRMREELFIVHGALLLVLWCFDSLFILARWATAVALWHYSKYSVYAPVFGIENSGT